MNLGIKIKKDMFLDVMKWVIITLLLVALLIVDNKYHSYDTYSKDVIQFLIVLGIIFLFLITKLGRLVIVLGKEAYFELQKIVWPSCQDSVNTTLVIMTVTTVISLVLWGLDTVLVNLISFGLRL